LHPKEGCRKLQHGARVGRLSPDRCRKPAPSGAASDATRKFVAAIRQIGAERRQIDLLGMDFDTLAQPT
jgi:hypothetical protein